MSLASAKRLIIALSGRRKEKMAEPYLPLTHMLWGPPEMSYLQLCPCGPSSLFLNRNIISQSQQTIQTAHCDVFSISFPWQQLLGFRLCTLEDHLNWFWFCSTGVSFLFWGEEQKIETYANSFRLWQSWCCCSWKGFWSYLVNSLAEFTQHAPAPPKDLVPGMV